MDYLGVIARNYETIRARAEEFGLPPGWAIKRRKEHLEDIIKENEELITDYVKELGKVNELGRAFLLGWIKNAQKRIKNARFNLSRLKPQTKKDGISSEEIERAKEYPVIQLLPNTVKHGMTLCPFHDDRNPSMSIKDNHAHCFACNKGWDSIDLVMQLRGYEFIEAVKYLNEAR